MGHGPRHVKLGLLLALAAALANVAEAEERFALPPVDEATFGRLVDPGPAGLPGGVHLVSASVERYFVDVTYRTPAGEAFSLRLVHPEAEQDQSDLAVTERFRIISRSASPLPPAALAALVRRIRAEESGWNWITLESLHARSATPRRWLGLLPAALWPGLWLVLVGGLPLLSSRVRRPLAASARRVGRGHAGIARLAGVLAGPWPDLGEGWLARALRLLPVALVVVLLALASVLGLCAAPALRAALLGEPAAIPVAFLGVWAATLGAILLLPAGRKWRLGRDLLICGGLLATYVTAALPRFFGDAWAWPQYAASELLATVLYSELHVAGLPLGWVPPFFGFATALVALRYFRPETAGASASRLPAVAFDLVYFGSGLHAIFFLGLIENTCTSLPFLLAAVAVLAAYADGSASRAALSGGALLLALAGLFHGQAAFLVPLVPIAVFLRYRRHGLRTVGAAALDLLAGLGLGVALVGVVARGVTWMPRTFQVGNLTGGPADTRLFVPVQFVAGSSAPFTMGSPLHWEQWTTILVAVSPLVLLAAPLAALPAVRRAVAQFVARDAGTSLLASAVLGYLLFVFLWGFDMGFPGDWDLMTSMGVLLVVLVARASAMIAASACGWRPVAKAAFLSLLLANAAVGWWIIFSVAGPRGQ